MNLLLTGATGFAGGEVLRQALADPAIARVTVLTRRMLDLAHPKLKTIVIADFLDYSDVPLAGHDACIWCLGVSQSQVGEDEYVRITQGYAVAAASAMLAANPALRFCFVSGRSADPTEASPALFARIKGRTERKLAELGGTVFSFRPGYIRPTARSVPRKDLGRLFAPIGALVSLFNDDFSVDCDQLARCLLDVAKHGARRPVLANREIRRWALDGRPEPERSRPRRMLTWSGAVAITLMCALLAAALMSACTGLGGRPEGERLARVKQSPEWQGDQLQNPQPMWSDGRGAWARWLFGPAAIGTAPDSAVAVVHDDAATFSKPSASGLRVTWFGHSSALIEIDGSRVLIDPFWSERASPVSWTGPKRWYPPPAALGDLPEIDAVLISHDHYDHLDRATIVAMASWKTVFVVPLGVGAHLARWGIPEARIIELDWWQSTRVGGIDVVATPARHASGRVSTKSNQTLWAGYAIIGPQHRAWYSGDTGFHAELGRIGERLGPFDVTLVEAGQYDALWPDTHLGPEQAVEAHRLVRGKTMIPVHWALLSLAEHAWTEPAERVLAAAQCRHVAVLIPRPGESVEPTLAPVSVRWWPAVPWRTAAQDPVVATQQGNASDRVGLEPCG